MSGDFQEEPIQVLKARSELKLQELISKLLDRATELGYPNWKPTEEVIKFLGYCTALSVTIRHFGEGSAENQPGKVHSRVIEALADWPIDHQLKEAYQTFAAHELLSQLHSEYVVYQNIVARMEVVEGHDQRSLIALSMQEHRDAVSLLHRKKATATIILGLALIATFAVYLFVYR